MNKNENVKVETENQPIMKITKITKRICRTIPTGDYQNSRIELEVETEIFNNEDFEEVSTTLKNMINQQLDIEEAEILAKAQTKQEDKVKEQIQEIMQPQQTQQQGKYKVWTYTGSKYGGALKVSNNPNFKMVCPLCGKPLQKRKGKFGEFYGCAGYRDDGCNWLVNVSDVENFIKQQLGEAPAGPSGREIHMAVAKTPKNYHNPNYYNQPQFMIPETDEYVDDLPVSEPMMPTSTPYSNYSDDGDIPF